MLTAPFFHFTFIAEENLQQVILAPVEYLTSMPSKGVRNAAIDALNVWFQVPNEPLNVIKPIVNLLHSSSLM